MTDETTAAMPAETTAPIENVEPTTTEAETPQVETTQPDDAGAEDKPKGGFQRRIKELSDDRNYWRDLAMRAHAPPEPQREEPQRELSLPTLEQHGFDEAKYQAALIEYATKQAEAVVERRLAEAEKQRTEQARISTFAERQRDFAKANPDFVERVMQDPTLPITPAMRDVIVDSESGPEIAYWLANNREQAERIAALPPHLSALEMGRIEGRLSVQKAKPRPVVTQAPPPPPTVDAEPSVSVKASTSDSDKLSDAEWMKLREKELKRKKG